MATENITSPIDCACLIHGNAYSWEYVDRLYNMLSRNLSGPVTLHVYTEESRPVPEPYIKHSLEDWGIVGPKKSWWYKIQIFNDKTFNGPLLYFDLDTVIVGNLDWIRNLSLDFFWSIRDFKHLWNDQGYGFNSSIMWWHTKQYNFVWKNFINSGIHEVISKNKGDQDWITAQIPDFKKRFFPGDKIKSWRWECFDGGYNFDTKKHKSIGEGTKFPSNTSVLVFHGKPKPGEVKDPVIVRHWQ